MQAPPATRQPGSPAVVLRRFGESSVRALRRAYGADAFDIEPFIECLVGP
jgi:hypothetical protein